MGLPLGVGGVMKWPPKGGRVYQEENWRSAQGKVSALYPKTQLLQNAWTQLPFLHLQRAPPQSLAEELRFRRQPKWVRIGCRGCQVNHWGPDWRPAQGRVSQTRPQVQLLQKARTQLPFLYLRRAPPRMLESGSKFRRQPKWVRILVGLPGSTAAPHNLVHQPKTKEAAVPAVRRKGG